MNAAHERGERVRFVTLTDKAAGRMTVPELGAAWNRLAVRLRREKLLTEYALAVELQPKRGALHLHAYLPWIAAHTRRDAAQVWVLRSGNKPHDDPWDWMTRLAERRGTTANALYAEEKLAPDELARDPLA